MVVVMVVVVVVVVVVIIPMLRHWGAGEEETKEQGRGGRER